MTSPIDRVLNDCSIPGRPGRWAIGLGAGRVTALTTAGGLDCALSYDLDGRLVSPSFVDAHTHLDKCFTSHRTAHAVGAGLRDAIPILRADKCQNFTVEDIRDRVTRALRLSVEHGTGYIRTNVEADPFVELRAIDSIATVRTQHADRIDVQIVAFPQEGWFDSDDGFESGCAPYVRSALEQGADVVGGNVNAALWPSRPEDQVDDLFRIARERGCDIDMHLDNWDGADAFTLPYVAAKTVEHGLQGRVTVAHIPSLAHVPPTVADDTIRTLLEANISVAIQPTRVRLAPARALMDAGVNVLVGTDNLRDAFLPFGQADPLEAGLLFALLTGMTATRDAERVWNTLTVNPAKAMGIPDYGLEPGCAADLVVLDERSVAAALLHRAERIAVFKRGALVHATTKFPCMRDRSDEGCTTK